MENLKKSREERLKNKFIADKYEAIRKQHFPSGEKLCPHCGETKLITDFGINNAKPTGLSNDCLDCQYARFRSQKPNLDEKRKEYEELYSQQVLATKEKIKEDRIKAEAEAAINRAAMAEKRRIQLNLNSLAARNRKKQDLFSNLSKDGTYFSHYEKEVVRGENRTTRKRKEKKEPKEKNMTVEMSYLLADFKKGVAYTVRMAEKEYIYHLQEIENFAGTVFYLFVREGDKRNLVLAKEEVKKLIQEKRIEIK